jgi:xylitol oxidase
VGAIRALRGQGERMAELLLISEIRTVAADDLWMSPCYGTPCAVFHFSFKRDWQALQAVLPHVETALAPFEPRPHWGKMFTMAPREFHTRFPRLEDFRALLQTYDPLGKFRNAFVERNVF